MNRTVFSTTVCPPESDLKAYLDADLHWFHRRRICRHLHSCAPCAETARAMILLGREVRQWQAAQAPPEALRRRLLLRLKFAPEERPQSYREERQPETLRWAGVALVTAALAAWLLLAPQGRHGRIMAATVREALQNVNTWHLQGWKLVEGKRVPWEIWGRHSPFFYREQLGAQVVMDDGTERVQVFPPEPSLGRLTGLVVKTTSRPGDDDINRGVDFAPLFAAWPSSLKPWKETNDRVVFNLIDAGMSGPGTVTDNLYTVDKRTALPVQMEVRRGHTQSPGRLTSEYLMAEYDVPLPALDAVPPGPSDYPVVDTTCTAPASLLPHENAASADGVTVQATPLGADADGNILVRIHAWLGNVPLGVRPPLSALVGVKRSRGATDASPPVVHDDQGRGYVGVEVQNGPPNQISEDRLIVLSPMEPLPAQAPRPRRVALTLRVAPAVAVAVSGLKGAATSQTLLDENIGIGITLPENPGSFDHSRLHGLSDEPFSAMVAIAQADYWINGFDWTDPSDLMRLKGLHSIAWRKQALQRLPPGNRDAPLEHEALLQAYGEMARRYQHLGDRQHATEALRALLAESNQPPARPPGFRNRAEDETRAWTHSAAQ